MKIQELLGLYSQNENFNKIAEKLNQKKYLNLQSQIGGVDPTYNPKSSFIVETRQITSPLYYNYGNQIYYPYNINSLFIYNHQSFRLYVFE